MRSFPIHSRSQRGGSWSPRGRTRRHGFALVLVLCFVILISVIVLAYLSHSVLNRQIANTSASGTRADLFAQGAIDSILGDLKQEIVTGSTASTTTPPYYTPLGATNAVPALSGNSDPTDLPNLLKVSNSSTPFYPSDPVTRASNDSTTDPSINGRSVSLARWNDPLLLPKAKPGSTTVDTPDNNFVAPTWILVARDGTNPTAFSKAMAPTVVGRYAFAIYNEGGLLDLNVAGYPSTSPTNVNLLTHKAGLAHADLSQIPGVASADIDKLVGWRNYATTGQAGNTFPNFSFTAASATAYFDSVLSTPNFLTTANTALAAAGTDQKFTSRQQLIDFFNNGLGAANSAPLQDALQYFGTFSRGLNQPSFTPDPHRPVTPATDPTNSGNSLNGQDSMVNPAFLSVTVQSTFARNDGTNAVVGEPLVKKRFALNRLAWLTYEGPSANRNIASPSPTSGNADYDIYQLENQYGITQTFLAEGTPANIQAYFGLKWVQDSLGNTGYWQYINSTTGINKLSDVQALPTPREADFFELLKSAIPLGSLGKAATSKATDPFLTADTSTNPGKVAHEQAAFANDTDVDYAIMQIGINILAQSTTDGYPPRIQFTDNNGTQEFRGIKNLPYFYRIRVGNIISALPNPAPLDNTPDGVLNGQYQDGVNSYPDAEATRPLTSPGSYAVLFEPEVWNPHDANCSLGNPRPPYLRVVADGAPIDQNGSVISNPYPGPTPNQIAAVTVSANNGTSSASQTSGGSTIYTNQPQSPNFVPQIDAVSANGFYGTTAYTKASYQWTANNTALTFQDSSGTLFREPTLLVEPNRPGGSNLALGPANLIRSLYGTSSPNSLGLYAYPQNPTPATINGINCLNDLSQNPQHTFGEATQPGNAVPYIGFFYGTGPLRWIYTQTIPPEPASVFTASVMEAIDDEAVVNASTYRVQYSNDQNNWVTYDQKYIADLAYHRYPFLSGVGNTSDPIQFGFEAIGADGFYMTCSDPRTRRFGSVGNSPRGDIKAPTDQIFNAWGEAGYNSTIFPPPDVNSAGHNFSFWTDQQNNVAMTDRPTGSGGLGWNQGSGIAIPVVGLPNVGGWYPGSASNQAWNNYTEPPTYFLPGFLSQNNPFVTSDGPVWENSGIPGSTQYFADPDGVVRRAMGGYNSSTSGPSDGTIYGLPMAATVATTGYPAPTNQSQSRPIILNRPFRSVAELGYVFSGTPWRNLDMFTPESAAAPLLDVFCIQADDNPGNPSPLTAGTVDLNTRQVPVLQAVLAGAYYDEVDNTANNLITQTEAGQIAQALVNRTSDLATAGKGPLTNIADLVGRYYTTINATHGGIDGSQSYVGLSSDLSNIYGAASAKYDIERLREAAIRPLAAVGNTRVWNLMIDLIAQTGKYPPNAAKLGDFYVEGETRYWLHVAIDRATGQVIDQSLEVVK